jgi:hypothetical protein
LELPSRQRGKATAGGGQPTAQAISDCAPCAAAAGGGPGSLADNYQAGYQAGVQARNAGDYNDNTVPFLNPSNQYEQGFNDGNSEGGTNEQPSPGYGFTYNPQSMNSSGRRPRSLYNTRALRSTNLRRGVARYI